MNKMLKVLHKSCQCSDGTDDQKKGTQLLEVAHLESTPNTSVLLRIYAASREARKSCLSRFALRLDILEVIKTRV